MAPLVVAVVGGFIAIVIGKQVFGGWAERFNPAMVARVALLVSLPGAAHPVGADEPGQRAGAGFPAGAAHLRDQRAAARRHRQRLAAAGPHKTEMSRGIDLLQSLAAANAPALSWFGTRAGSLAESAC